MRRKAPARFGGGPWEKGWYHQHLARGLPNHNLADALERMAVRVLAKFHKQQCSRRVVGAGRTASSIERCIAESNREPK